MKNFLKKNKILKLFNKSELQIYYIKKKQNIEKQNF